MVRTILSPAKLIVNILKAFVQVLAHRGKRLDHVRPINGCKMDIWAVGILAYELMLGGPPFESDTKEETYDKILHDSAFYPSLWSEHAKDFLSQARFG